ncbi:MAG TPA: hypothetical protein PLV13_07225, partial [Ilumatobacteraceae bacterium]|nr:hypothetical protein [Ilumatobacteraceae bacterium]
ARLFVPGEECVAKLISGTLPPTTLGGSPTIPGRTTTTTTTAPPETVPGDSTPPVTSGATQTAVIEINKKYTTVPADVLDRRAPLPSAKLSEYFYLCGAPPPNVSVKER